MSNFTKHLLSGSTNGRQIDVVATASLGTTIHTATSSASDIDEIYLYAFNRDTSSVLLTIEWGGVANSDLIQKTIPSKDGYIFIAPGTPLQNSLVVTAFAATTGVISIQGHVHRYIA